MRTKCLPLYIPRDLYERLERQALAEERDPLQQARWLLRQALSTETVGEQTNPEQREVASAGAR